MFMKIAGIALFVIGAVIFYTAKLWVKKFKLADRMKTPNADEFNEDEMKVYRDSKAQITVKLVSLVLMLPGIVLIMIAFK